MMDAINWELCCLCQEVKDERLQTPKEEDLASIAKDLNGVKAIGVMPFCLKVSWAQLDEGAAYEAESQVTDANGNVLTDGDTVSVIKDLKVKGTSSVVKVGTKVKNIRLVDGDHDIDCKIDGIGAMKLKSQFVKKV